jgi:hypothetical protein
VVPVAAGSAPVAGAVEGVVTLWPVNADEVGADPSA